MAIISNNYPIQKNTHFFNLHEELQLKIFTFLSDEDLIHRVNVVCKTFQTLTKNRELWDPRLKILFEKNMVAFQNTHQ